MTSVSIIVPAYNVAEYIGDALNSVLPQISAGVELLVIDDGSTDNTASIARTILAGVKGANVISVQNSGPGAARNLGIRTAGGEYLFFLDGDDWAAEDAVEKLRTAASSTKADIILSNRRRFWEKNGTFTTKPLFQRSYTGPIMGLPEILGIHAVHGKLFRRSFLIDNKIDFPEGMSSEDFVFSYRCNATVEKVSTVPEVTYFYRKRKGDNKSLTQARLTHFNLTSRMRQIEMTLEIVANSQLRLRFPGIRFERMEFETRLMRHLIHLPNAEAQERAAAFDLLRPFVTKHRPLIEKNVSPGARKIYEAIILGNLQDTCVLIADREARRAAKKAGEKASSQEKVRAG